MIHSCPYCGGQGEVEQSGDKVRVFCLLCDYESESYSVKFLGYKEAERLAIEFWNNWIQDYPKSDLF